MGKSPPDQPSRYEPLLKLAAGGMATVWLGAARGGLGFRQLVAIKRPHSHLVDKPEFRRELIAEARTASLIHHANIVDVRDVEVSSTGEISLIMDYVEGATLGELLVAANKANERVPPAVVVRIVLDALAGLHAAHELLDERGRVVGLVHRDVSPQNVLVGTDGLSRVADFGIAKLTELSTTHGVLKGKLSYMAPEYLRGEKIDRRFDVFAMGVVLWEALTGRRLFRGDNEADTFNRILSLEPERICDVVPSLGNAFDSVVQVALAKSRDERFDNAHAMASALESCARTAGLEPRHGDVASEVQKRMGTALAERRVEIRAKLSEEPSLLSLMQQPGTVKLPDLDAPPPVTTLAPPTVPEPKPKPEPVAPPPIAEPVAEAAEPSRGYEPVELPGVSSRSGARVVAILGAFVGLGVVAGAVLALRASDDASRPRPPSVTAPVVAATSAPASTSPAPSVSASASSSAPPSVTRPPASAHPAPTTKASAHHAAGGTDPPPNPYAE